MVTPDQRGELETGREPRSEGLGIVFLLTLMLTKCVQFMEIHPPVHMGYMHQSARIVDFSSDFKNTFTRTEVYAGLSSHTLKCLMYL